MEKKRKENYLCQMDGLKAPPAIASPVHGRTILAIFEMLPSAHRGVGHSPDAFSKPFVEYIGNGGVAIGTTVDAKMPRGTEELGAAFREMA